MYRVRRKWRNSKSQIGEFVSLQDAKLCALKAGDMYSVYDDNGKVVYKVKSTDWLKIRSSWSDADSQIGQFRNLDMAKQYADASGKTVFDWDGNIIYVGRNDSGNVLNSYIDPNTGTKYYAIYGPCGCLYFSSEDYITK